MKLHHWTISPDFLNMLWIIQRCLFPKRWNFVGSFLPLILRDQAWQRSAQATCSIEWKEQCYRFFKMQRHFLLKEEEIKWRVVGKDTKKNMLYNSSPFIKEVPRFILDHRRIWQTYFSKNLVLCRYSLKYILFDIDESFCLAIQFKTIIIEQHITISIGAKMIKIHVNYKALIIQHIT